jgi:hypothetical protein
MKTTGKKWSIVVIPHRKCSRKGTGSKHVDSNTVVERPLESYRRDSQQLDFGTTLVRVVTDVDAFIGSRLTKRIVIHDIPLLIVICRVTAQICN